MIQTVKVLVYGKVQGVYFRQSTKKQALALGVVGTVRNLADGSVEIIAQAEDPALQALLAWSQQGPVMARVDRVQVTTLEPIEGLGTFRVV
jgi:acylphosphatase